MDRGFCHRFDPGCVGYWAESKKVTQLFIRGLFQLDIFYSGSVSVRWNRLSADRFDPGFGVVVLAGFMALLAF